MRTFILLLLIFGSTFHVFSQDFTQPITVSTNNDAVMTFNNTDDSWQYFQFRRNGVRKTWMGLGVGNSFNIVKEGGGYIYLGGANVGIGTTNPLAKLSVNGTIRAKEVKVLTDIQVPDYVFDSEYKLRSLAETKFFIETNKHLPEIPSAKEIAENGMDIADMNLRLLKKIEELTLYQIQLLEKVNKLQEEIELLKTD